MNVKPPQRPFSSALLVDDDPLVVRFLESMIASSFGPTPVRAASNGEEAIRAYQLSRPDLVLMDINLGIGISGIEATERILQLDPSARVIVLTTIAPGPGLAGAIEAGAIATVNKAASTAELQRVLTRSAQGDDPSIVEDLISEVSATGLSGVTVPQRVQTPTRAEMDTLLLICVGLDYQDIANRRCVSLATVKSQTAQLRQKLGARSLAQLVVRALQLGYLSP